MPLDPSTPPPLNPDDRIARRLADLERRVAAVERINFETIVFDGVRTDLAGGRGPRLRVGLAIDGTTFTVERWLADGTHQVATFS